VARELHAGLGGRATRAETIHLTLLFIGDLDRDRLPDLQAAARGIRRPGFEMRFDHRHCWGHNHIAWIGPSATPPGLLDLVGDLEARVGGLGIPFDRRPYQAHVTLVRKAACQHWPVPAATTPETIDWAARDFVLVASRLDAAGPRYDLLERFPLL
jgi:2'-5' RNA ligase